MTTPTKTDPSLNGTLSTESLARVLGTLHGEKHTGVLHLRRGEERLTLRFVSGHVVSGAQGPSGRLGEILMRCGQLDRADLDKALEKAALEGRRLGPVLIEEHFASRAAVQEALRLQVRDVLFAALFWTFGAYRFEPDNGPTQEEEITLEISTTGLIFKVVSALPHPGVALRGLLDFATPVAAAPEGLARLRADGAPLSPADAYVLSRADGILTVGQIVDMAPLPAPDVERSLLALLCCQALLPRPRRVIDPSHTVSMSREELGVTPERLIAMRKQELEETLRSFASRSHFEVLGVEPTASVQDVKSAYARLVKEYHPDAVRHLDLVEATNKVFLRVSEAYEVVSNPELRQRLLETRDLRKNTPWASATTIAPEEAQPLPEGADALPEAERLLANGKSFEAVALLENVLPHLQGRLRCAARLLRARAYLKTPSGSRLAETELGDLLKEDPTNLEGCLMLGTLYRDKGLGRRAAKAFTRALELSPGHPGALRELRSLPSGYSLTQRLKLGVGVR